jgi:hypothetical protein
LKDELILDQHVVLVNVWLLRGGKALDLAQTLRDLLGGWLLQSWLGQLKIVFFLLQWLACINLMVELFRLIELWVSPLSLSLLGFLSHRVSLIALLPLALALSVHLCIDRVQLSNSRPQVGALRLQCVLEMALVSLLFKCLFLIVQIEVGLAVKVVVSEHIVLVGSMILLGETHKVVQLTHWSGRGKVRNGLGLRSYVEVFVYVRNVVIVVALVPTALLNGTFLDLH